MNRLWLVVLELFSEVGAHPHHHPTGTGNNTPRWEVPLPKPDTWPEFLLADIAIAARELFPRLKARGISCGTQRGQAKEL